MHPEKIKPGPPSGDGWEIRSGDFRKILADLHDVDAIVTDPPYTRKFIPLWSELGEYAARVLKPGGFLATYCGTYFLPECIAALGKSLNWHWQAVVVHTGGKPRCHQKRISNGYKPILIFSKGKPDNSDLPDLPDVIKGTGREKEFHEWQQAAGEAVQLIEKLTMPGELIIDPCCGSGTTGLDAISCGRRFIGCDIDKKAVRKARARLARDAKQVAA